MCYFQLLVNPSLSGDMVKKKPSVVTMKPRQKFKRKKPGAKSKFKPEFYVLCFRLALEGSAIRDMAPLCGVAEDTFRGWMKSRRAFRKAIREGQAMRKGGKGHTLSDWVYGQLAPEMQEVWDELKSYQKRRACRDKVKAMFDKRGQAVRKQMFLHALVTKKFNMSAALQMCCLSKRELDLWINEDDRFAELIKEMEWHLNNFYESKLVELVKEKDTAAVLMVNKSRNKDRGYAERMEVEHKGKIVHDHRHKHMVCIDELDLPAKILRSIHNAMEKKEVADANTVEANGHQVKQITDQRTK